MLKNRTRYIESDFKASGIPYSEARYGFTPAQKVVAGTAGNDALG
jgi:hypothetical protein